MKIHLYIPSFGNRTLKDKQHEKFLTVQVQQELSDIKNNRNRYDRYFLHHPVDFVKTKPATGESGAK